MDDIFQKLKECTGFAWDSGNCTKSAIKHGVSCPEAEEVFFNHPAFLLEDSGHRRLEQRIHAFGKTTKGRPLVVTFTIRDQKISIISARDQNRNELRPVASNAKTRWVRPEKSDSTSHLDLTQARPAPALPRLKPSTTTMNLRVPVSLLEELKQEANRRDVPYQSLVKVLLQEKLAAMRS